MFSSFTCVLAGTAIGVGLFAPVQALMNERAAERCKALESTHQLVTYSEDAFVGTAYACIDKRYL